MSSVLYYSKYCQNCNSIISKLSKTSVQKDIHFVCIDKRIKEGNKVYLLLDGVKKVLLPETVRKVPAILLLYQGYRVLYGKDIMNYYQPKINAETGVATKNNLEPSAYSYTEMGTNMSDDYSYLDQTSDEMAAKGEGGTRQMHSFMLLDQSQAIETPPEDYIPDKVKGNDLEQLQKQRSLDIKL
jgi:hypothetical protein|tara:strand:- start:3477 stop:4028 length:552 start_codon:yes stop_codon:yes gene_type:complete